MKHLRAYNFISSSHISVVTQLCAIWAPRVIKSTFSLEPTLIYRISSVLILAKILGTSHRLLPSGSKEITLLKVGSRVISSEFEFLYIENECVKLLFTNNSRVSFSARKDALFIPHWCCGNCHYHPQSL